MSFKPLRMAFRRAYLGLAFLSLLSCRCATLRGGSASGGANAGAQDSLEKAFDEIVASSQSMMGSSRCITTP
jgi:hypothetical protein